MPLREEVLTPGQIYRQNEQDSLAVLFEDGSRESRAHLGGKGANLAEMTRMGLPVPPGFVIPTAACHAFLSSHRLPDGLDEVVDAALATLGDRLGRRFGDERHPLLVSVRSGAPNSMPGMMDTILNVGLTAGSIEGLAEMTGSRSFALDCYRRLIRSIAQLDPDTHVDPIFESRPDADDGVTTESLRAEVHQLLAAFEREGGEPFPDDARQQLRLSVEAVFQSWMSKRAQRYRKFKGLPDTGTAVVVQSMVFGNVDDRSGTGVLFTRDPSTGEKSLYGDFLSRAQGEDIVAGTHDAADLQEMNVKVPEAFSDLERHAETLEGHFTDMCDVEFTVESGRLWLLQTRSGERSATAGARIAVEMVEEGLIDEATALERIDATALQSAVRPTLNESEVPEDSIIGRGIGASPGVARGRAVMDPARAKELHETGQRVILIRPETTPEDLDGILAADGLVTTRGGKTSHAAVVARGLGRTCVCGLKDSEVDVDGRTLTVGGTTVREGDELSIEGSLGLVMRGIVPLESNHSAPPELLKLLEWADESRSAEIRVFASSVDELIDPTVGDQAGDLRESLARTGTEVLVPEGMLETARATLGDWTKVSIADPGDLLQEVTESAIEERIASGSPVDVHASQLILARILAGRTRGPADERDSD